MVTKRPFGVTEDGIEVTAYTIANERGISVTVLDYGATLQSVILPYKNGTVDVVLGYDTIEGYERNDGYLGATIGRYAGRIPDSILRIGEDTFPITANEGVHHLHGGRNGLDRRVWKTGVAHGYHVQFHTVLHDGEDGYPGNIRFTAAYSLSSNQLRITYFCTSDRTTAWNPTNHTYWNLNGHDAGDSRSHRLEIPAARFVPVDTDRIPTGGEADVANTPFDFRNLREIGAAYDHSFVLFPGLIRLFGTRGIGMEVRTSCRAVQLYNAEFLSARKGKGGARYGPFGAVCLETEGRQAQRGMPIPAENVLFPDHFPNARWTQFTFLYGEQ